MRLGTEPALGEVEGRINREPCTSFDRSHAPAWECPPLALRAVNPVVEAVNHAVPTPERGNHHKGGFIGRKRWVYESEKVGI
jgi:hypothetical protein